MKIFVFFFFLCQEKPAKVLWFVVVSLGFLGAGFLIGNSYNEWQKNPISTSITTKPIADLEFPVVTVCPPKDINTALYHDLVKAGNETLSEKDRKTLKQAAYDIFLEKSHKDYVKRMLPLSNMGNIDQFLQGFHSLPMLFNSNNGMVHIKMWNLNGTITTPWFGESHVEEYYKEDREYHTVLEVPENIQDLVGSSSLIVKLEVDTRKDIQWPESTIMYTLHRTEKSWEEAEAHCLKDGGHLASAVTEEENHMLRRVWGSGKLVWVGGRVHHGKWSWSDNSTWEYTNWLNVPKSVDDDSCTLFGGRWDENSCKGEWPFICKSNTTMKLSYTKDQLSFSSISVWYKYEAASQQLLDSWKDKRMTGFRFSWVIQNPKVTWTSHMSEVGRSIQSPMLGDPFGSFGVSEHEYRATLTLPLRLSAPSSAAPPPPLPPPPPPPASDDFKEEAISYNSVVIEMNVNLIQADEMYAFTSYKFSLLNKIWSEAEANCNSKGGHLATIHSKWEQELAETAAGGREVWLGGRNRGGQWAWVDKTTWGFNNWASGRPQSREYLKMASNGQWRDTTAPIGNSFLCQGPTLDSIKSGSVRMEFTQEQLQFFPFHVLLKTQATNQRNMSASSGNKTTPSNFKLS